MPPLNHHDDDSSEDLKILLFIGFQLVPLKERNNFFIEVLDRSHTVFQHLLVMVVTTSIEIDVSALKNFSIFCNADLLFSP